jgi:hypothetical protein
VSLYNGREIKPGTLKSKKTINVRRIKNKNQWYLLEKNKNEITD